MGLKAARQRHAHSQSGCAAELKRMGAQTSQGTVSRWELGKVIPSADARSVIASYCAAAGIDLTDDQRAPSPDDDGHVPAARIDLEFEGAISEMTGSRPWSGRQAHFLDSVIRRIGSGPPMSKSDWDTANLLARLLGMDLDDSP